jgi:hypothetical protein
LPTSPERRSSRSAVGAGDVAEAKRRLEEEIGRYEGNELLVYNEAIAERASFAERARKDDDFASLRGDARFEEIVGATPG